MKFSEALPSKYLSAPDIGKKEVKLVMRNVEIEQMNDGKSAPVLYFTKARKGLVINKTNGLIIAAVYGDEMANWTGKEVILFTMKVQYKEKIVDAIRLEIPMPTQRAPAPVVMDEDPMPDDTLDGLPGDPDEEIPF
jgi:hypothetical protein